MTLSGQHKANPDYWEGEYNRLPGNRLGKGRLLVHFGSNEEFRSLIGELIFDRSDGSPDGWDVRVIDIGYHDEVELGPSDCPELFIFLSLSVHDRDDRIQEAGNRSLEGLDDFVMNRIVRNNFSAAHQNASLTVFSVLSARFERPFTIE